MAATGGDRARTTRALVTGASKGIGAAIARRLGAMGHPVIVNYNRDEAGAVDSDGNALDDDITGGTFTVTSENTDTIGVTATFEASATIELLDRDLNSTENLDYAPCADDTAPTDPDECDAGTSGQVDADKYYPGYIWGVTGVIKVNSTQRYSLAMDFVDGAGDPLATAQLVSEQDPANTIDEGTPVLNDQSSMLGLLEIDMEDVTAANGDDTDSPVAGDIQPECDANGAGDNGPEQDTTADETLFETTPHVATTLSTKYNYHCFRSFFQIPGAGVEAGEYKGIIKVTLTSDI